MTARVTGLSVVSGVIGFVAILGSLHLLRDDLDPSWRVISEYAVGAHGWLMVVGFLLLAAVSAALAIGSWRFGSRRLGRIGAVLLAITAVGMTMAGIFVTDLITVPSDQRSTDGRLHEVGALLDLTPFAAVIATLGLLRGTTSTQAARRALPLAMLGPLVGLITFATATALQMPANGTGSPDVLIGWPNRLLILGYCAWYAAAGWYLTQSSAQRPRGAGQ